MKKTIKYQTVGEFQIITGFGQMTIDPHATGANSLPKIAELEISKELQKKEKEKAGHFQKMKTAEVIAGDFLRQRNEAEGEKKNSEQLKKVAEGMNNDVAVKKHDLDIMGRCNDIAACEKGYHKHDQIYKAQGGAVEVKNSEMRKLLPEFDAQQKQVRRDNFVYDMPGKNMLIDRGTLVSYQCPECKALFYMPAEDDFRCSGCEYDLSDVVKKIMVPEGITVDALIMKWMIKPVNSQILISGESIADFRGKQYFFDDGDNWVVSEIITDLGVDKNTVVVDEYQDKARELNELEPQYQEKIRLQLMTQDEKNLEYNDKHTQLIKEVVLMKSTLEIQGKTAAKSLSESKAFYEAGLDGLKSIYNITE